jgi:hypothetical protein
MRLPNWRGAVVALAAVTFAWPGPVAAAGPSDAYARGVREFQNRDFKSAARDLKVAMDAKPRAAVGIYLGNAYLELGELDLAKAAFQQVLQLEPDHPKKAAIQTLVASIDAHAEVKLHVESTPAGATVFVDSEATGPRGTTPLDLNVLVGRHTILLKLDTYATESVDQTFTTGAPPPPLAVTLHGNGCDVALSARGPAAARASVDGADAVALPGSVHVAFGDHKVHFTADGYDPQDASLACDGFAPGRIDPVLTPMQGKLLLPRGARVVVRVDGQVVDGDKQVFALAPGRHEVAVTEGDEPVRTSVVDVVPGQTVALELPAEEAASGAFPKRALYVGVVGGGNVTLRDWDLGANAFQAQSGAARFTPGSAEMAGLRVGLQVTPRVAIETEAQWMSLPSALDTSQGITYGVAALWHVLRTEWTPVLEAGAGLYQVVSGRLGADLSGRASLGAGVRGRLARWLAIRADVRDVVSKGFSGPSDNLELLAGAEALFF